MQEVKLSVKSQTTGVIFAPSSKSMSHRAILAAMLSNTDTEVGNVMLSEDVEATLIASQSLGKKFKKVGHNISFSTGTKSDKVEIDCNESGSTFRFLIPICAALGITATYDGKGKLPTRPYKILCDLLTEKGVEFDKSEGMPLMVKGQLKSGKFEIAGDVSSQYVTGLLYALPLLKGDSEIVLTTPLESKGYVDMTVSVLKHFSVSIEETEKGYFIKGGQTYSGGRYAVEGDYSNAAFWLVYGALNDGIIVKNLDKNSLQGDKQIVEILQQMGAKISQGHNEVAVGKSVLKGITVDISQIPDLAPILSVAFAVAKGTGKIVNAKRLKIKESDRLFAINSNLNALGFSTELDEDSIVIFGKNDVKGGVVNGFADHRIVMSMAVLASRCRDGLIVSNAQAVNKSYPTFFEEYKKIGGQVDVVDLG